LDSLAEVFPIVSKFGVDWGDEVVKRLKAYFRGREIRPILDEIFPTSRMEQLDLAARIGTVRRGGMTHRLEDLFRKVRLYWDDLDKPLQARIEQHLDVHPDHGQIEVGLKGF
jgi:hypothetical protein